jgi:hypothetical protein
LESVRTGHSLLILATPAPSKGLDSDAKLLFQTGRGGLVIHGEGAYVHIGQIPAANGNCLAFYVSVTVVADKSLTEPRIWSNVGTKSPGREAV